MKIKCFEENGSWLLVTGGWHGIASSQLLAASSFLF
jgi:hypothetical protein